MTPSRAFSAVLFLFSGLPASAAEPEVSNVRSYQQPGTKQVIIDYRLSGNTTPVWVGVEGSADGGATWTLPVHQVTGHVGEGVSASPNARIHWNAGLDWNGNVSDAVRFRVTASAQAPLYADMVSIPAGSFMMGSNEPAPGPFFENPIHSVHVSAFRIGKHEVTKALWENVRAWGFTHGYTDLMPGLGKGHRHPVYEISWLDAVKWCNARSEMEGLAPCYKLAGTVFRTGGDLPSCDWTADGYRLPTEAEWEKAARGGLAGKRFPHGDTIDHSAANYQSITGFTYDTNPTEGYHPVWDQDPMPYTSPVGMFPANGYGLHDMSGNIAEWCWDGLAPYTGDEEVDPRDSAQTSAQKTARGGSWKTSATNQRCARRYNFLIMAAGDNLGFRVARKAATSP